MFVLISKCANRLVDYTEILVSGNEPVECLELKSKYTTDVIGSCAFGIEMKALSIEDSEFCKIGRKIFHPWSDRLRDKIRNFSPWLYDILGYVLRDTEITTFFIRLVIDTINYRKKNNFVRHDFIDMLCELIKHSKDKKNGIDFTGSFVASQVFVFFFAVGYEISSTAMANALYELALDQKIQNRLRVEIDQQYVK